MQCERGGDDLDPDRRAPTHEAIRQQLHKTLASKTFLNSPQLTRFLKYLVEEELAGHGEQLKEYVLAIEVFRKDDSFDSRVDTVVRTEARRLRQKLLEYYQSYGRSDPIEIILPKGVYRVNFQSREAVASPIPPSTPRNHRRWIAAAVLLLALSGAFWIVTHHRSEKTRNPSIAVVPLDNLSNDPEQEYFADGMTDVLVTDLAKIRRLSVISRTTMMRYKKTKKRVFDIGTELNADYIVEGTVTRAGNRVRITAQLIATATDHHLWAESFESTSKDILELQAQIARAIANHINIRLTPTEQASLLPAAINAEAQDLYLKGRFEWETREVERLKKSVEYFRQAIAIEPGYALAYAALADSYYSLENRQERAEFHALGCDASRKALALNDLLAEAHASLADCFDSWAWQDREREYRKSLDLNPNYALGHTWYGGLLIQTGRVEAGLAEMRTAAQLDPFSAESRFGLAWGLYINGQYDESIAQNQQTLEIFKNHPEAYAHIGLALSAKGKHPEAIEVLEKAMKLTGGAPPIATLVAHSQAQAGDPALARKLVADFQHRPDINPLLLGLLSMDSGDKDKAFQWLEHAVEKRSRFSQELKVEPMYRPLHTDPRWNLLLRKMNFAN